MLPSTIRYSRSGSPATASKTRCHIPLWDQRLLDNIITYQARQDDQYDLKSLPIPTVTMSSVSTISYRNLDKTFSFVANLDNVTILSRFEAKFGLASYRINWIELSVPSISYPVLLCVGAQGASMSRLTEDTDRLHEELQSRIANR